MNGPAYVPKYPISSGEAVELIRKSGGIPVLAHPAVLNRDDIIEELGYKGVECKKYFPPIHLKTHYRKVLSYKEGDLPVTESVSKRTIALPFYGKMREAEITYIVDQLKEVLNYVDVSNEG